MHHRRPDITVPTWLKRPAVRYIIPVLVDALSVVVAFYTALALRFTGQAALLYLYLTQYHRYVLIIAAVYCFFNAVTGLYSFLWDYASSQEIMPIVEATAIGTLCVLAIDLLWRLERPLPLSSVVAGGILTLGAFIATRYRLRWFNAAMRSWQARQGGPPGGLTRVLIVGAGEAGQLLTWRLQTQTPGLGYHIIGFVDDDRRKHGMLVHGIEILGDRHLIPAIVQERAVNLVVIAIHNIATEDFRDILSICQGTTAQIKLLPNIFERLGSRYATPLRDITLGDLVGRASVGMSLETCTRAFGGKVVLIAGAGGSIGSELCRLLASLQPASLVMVDNNETGIHDLSVELQARAGAQGASGQETVPKLRYVVADVTRQGRMEEVFREYRPNVVLHSAAYKHVPLMEDHPAEAIRVNIGSTLVLLNLAEKYGTELFVFISSDKAVEPISVMGATKRVCESLVAGRHSEGGLVATAVRFGNVLGSRGSVVPTFEKQIEMGGPVTITHPDMTRYFMSISEASGLVLHAATLARGGEIFLLDMGQQTKIADLAYRMIRARGLRVGRDISIVHTGIRQGEKMEEKLLASYEDKSATSHPGIFSVRSTVHVDLPALESALEGLLALAEVGAERSELKERLLATVRAGLPS